ncbi:plasma membrane phospholipid-translocating ATPase complex, ATPase subunit [Schizosaccharomyces osmophilus]|uniref:Phospholipid-transporting ATPase n=1 Tax=Schizosaccharomyces osmophilus TaxID=2545709 RepID=A0AAE9WDD6_9SCHI|nr:plasma membrane phospholipid-translocating ATPase complex, ATPase subunit [Schizosaccharomyces osmophilus]WBW73122.1 plasma membrane phospholipid-translocating ATPase complex, ATPase subunit [Schizosaccharomyces osmophilus]
MTDSKGNSTIHRSRSLVDQDFPITGSQSNPSSSQAISESYSEKSDFVEASKGSSHDSAFPVEDESATSVSHLSNRKRSGSNDRPPNSRLASCANTKETSISGQLNLPDEAPSRRIYVNHTPDEHVNLSKQTFPSNKIRTSMYTPLNFVPKNLYNQFRNVANVFFLFLILLQLIPAFAARHSALPFIPLSIILLSTGIKDGFEDYRRSILDKKFNHTITFKLVGWRNVNCSMEHIGIWRRIKKLVSHTVRYNIKSFKNASQFPPYAPSVLYSERNSRDSYSSNFSLMSAREGIEALGMGNASLFQNFSVVTKGPPQSSEAHFEPVYRKKIQVGDIVRVRANEAIPADLLILSTENKEGVCYVETKNLDGETNLKDKYSLHSTKECRSELECSSASFWIHSEEPHSDLYNLIGVLKAQVPDNISQTTENTSAIKQEPFNMSNIALCGCTLRNSKWIIGLALYTGPETRIQMNRGVTPSKRSRITRELNWTIALNFVLLFLMCIISGLLRMVFSARQNSAKVYEFYELSKATASVPVQGIVSIFTCLILFQNLVPISLYITIDIVRTMQSFFIYSDIEMYDEKLDYPCSPKSWNISDDLGQIEYVFSDKTGTLTQNVMYFKRTTINGKVYGEAYTDATRGFDRAVGRSNAKQRLNEIEEDRDEMIKLSKYGSPETSTFVSSTLVRELQSPTEQSTYCRKFFTVLALCHSVVTDGHGDSLVYNSQSPDEEALVKAACNLGFILKSTKNKRYIVEILGKRERFQVLDIIPFTSARRRMSIIIQDKDKQIYLYCKGADSVILNRLAENNSNELIEKTAQDLSLFAAEGFRTLCIAERKLEKNEYLEWKVKFNEASLALHDRNEKIDQVSNLVEKELSLLGGTAIEDKLQDGVPETIDLLSRAGIKLWVLTGDKVETATNIGYSCNLLESGMSIIHINSSFSEPEQIKDYILKNLSTHFGLEGSEEEFKIMMQNHDPPSTKYAVVIDGSVLSMVLESEFAYQFVMLCKNCRTVLCCRVSPSQKAAVVSLVKRSLDVTTLAIGDGANDVSMIQQADIGVGIAGLEGQAAAMASDYAVGQFRFLSRLLLVHGRWNYKRTSQLISNFFYKNVIWTFTLFWYQLFNEFDGNYIFDYTYVMLFNLLFTSVPVIVSGCFDKDVDAEASLKYPHLYKSGILRQEWSKRRFWLSVLDGIYQSMVCFGVALFVFYAGNFVSPTGHQTESIEDIGLFISSPAIFVINTYILINQESLDLVSVGTWLFSLIVFWFWTGVYSESLDSNAFHKSTFRVGRTLAFWVVNLLTIVVSLFPRLSTILAQKLFFPREVDMLKWKIKREEGLHMEDQASTVEVSTAPPSLSTSVRDDSPNVSYGRSRFSLSLPSSHSVASTKRPQTIA